MGKKKKFGEYFWGILMFLILGFLVGVDIRGRNPWLLEHDFIVKFGIVITGLVCLYFIIFWTSPDKKGDKLMIKKTLLVQESFFVKVDNICQYKNNIFFNLDY